MAVLEQLDYVLIRQHAYQRDYFHNTDMLIIPKNVKGMVQ